MTIESAYFIEPKIVFGEIQPLFGKFISQICLELGTISSQNPEFQQ